MMEAVAIRPLIPNSNTTIRHRPSFWIRLVQATPDEMAESSTAAFVETLPRVTISVGSLAIRARLFSVDPFRMIITSISSAVIVVSAPFRYPTARAVSTAG